MERKLLLDAKGARRHIERWGAVTALPDLALGLLYVAALVDRALLPAGTVNAMARAIPIEFAVVHCSGFLGAVWVARWGGRKRALYIGALAGFYSLGLAIFSLAVGGLWPLAIFWGLMANRMLAALLGDLPDDRRFSAWATAWAGTTTLYVLGVVIGVFAGPSDFTRALVIGFGYFTMVGLSEITGWAWVYRWQAWAQARAGRGVR